MAYTWTAENPLVDGTDYPQAAMINEIRNILDHMNNYKMQAHLSVNQSIPNTTTTLIALDTIDYDPNSNFSVSTHLWTCPFTGYYALDFMGNFPTATSGAVAFLLQKNGSNMNNSEIDNHLTSGQNTGGTISQKYKFTSGDTVGVLAYQGSGGSLNLVGNGGSASQGAVLSIHFISTN